MEKILAAIASKTQGSSMENVDGTEADPSSDDDVEFVEFVEKDAFSKVMTKKPKVQEFWKPESIDHCPEFKAYLVHKKLHQEIFVYASMNKKDQKGSNWVIGCMCCTGFDRRGCTTLILEHFIEKSCPLNKVPKGRVDGLEDYLADLASKRLNRYGRNLASAEKSRTPNEDEKQHASSALEGFLKSAQVRQKVLLTETAKMMIGCNLAPNIVENATFRQFVHMVSGGKITYSETQVLKRKAVTKEMDAFSKAKCDRAKDTFLFEAKQKGGTLIVDGWTAAKLIGTIGVSLCSMFTCCIMPLLLSGVERSRASDYIAKLEDEVPWTVIYFACTDGASNMVSFGETLKETKSMLPCLCAAHGFSLSVHYVGKVFEERSSMFSSVSGIIAFFNRSNQRLAYLRKESEGLGFIKFCKTRMAYQTLALMRLFRLRTAAKKAVISIEDQKLNEDEELIDPFSKLASVKKSLNDDRLFQDIELFCRITLPILLAMREVDRGTPMAGFVYWLHYHVESQVKQILEKLVAVDSGFKRLGEEITSALQFVWDKRHRPVLAFAYLTNPVFHEDLSKEEDVFGIDPNFREDVEDVLLTMVKKRFLGQDVDVMHEYGKASNELTSYLKPGSLTEVQKYDAKSKMAADFWTSSSAVNRFPELAFYARRAQAMPVVTSKLERFFSHVGNVQTEKRASLDPQHASLYAAAHQQIVEAKEPPSSIETQKLLLELVRRCEALETEEEVFKFEQSPGFSELEEWLEGIRVGKLEMLYKKQLAEAEEIEETNDVGAIPPIHDENEQEEGSTPDLITEYDAGFANRDVRRSGRARKPTRKLNL